MYLYTVRYHLATYEGTVEVFADEDADPTYVIAKAKDQLRRRSGPFPFGYESWKIVEVAPCP